MDAHVRMPMLLSFLGMLVLGCEEGTVNPGRVPVSLTAARKAAEVDSLAASFGTGLRLVTILSRDVKVDGSSDIWQYVYVDVVPGRPATSYWFHADEAAVAFDSTSAVSVGMAVITRRWVDSDSALVIAELNGGLMFRRQNPQCTISASLGEAVVPDPIMKWWIVYRSRADNSTVLFVTVDAAGGEVTKMHQ
jgi:hypothetical protein